VSGIEIRAIVSSPGRVDTVSTPQMRNRLVKADLPRHTTRK
jgi:hypothetical protein